MQLGSKKDESRILLISAPRLAAPALQGVNATFVYDGDGQRVKSTIGGVTTYFVGNHYEVTGTEITKYYFAGTQRIATLAPHSRKTSGRCAFVAVQVCEKMVH